MKILKFSAEWCTPCKMLQKTLDEMVLPYPVENIDIDKKPDLFRKIGLFNSNVMPTLNYLHGNTVLLLHQ